jgi:hypothetical protein
VCRDLIINVNVDATISFKTVNSFFRVMDGGSTISDEIGKGKLSLNGATEALESFHMKWLRVCDLPNTINAEAPVRQNRFVSVETPAKPGKTQPLKAGWLLKKRDIFSGWRCRYFVVYADRLEYFVDQYDSAPKATLSLVDVEVQPVKRVNMPGTGEHWGIMYVADPAVSCIATGYECCVTIRGARICISSHYVRGDPPVKAC